MNITRGKMGGAEKIVIFGPEGIGKSTFASSFPDPLFIDTEGSTKHLDVARFDAPTSWAMLLQEVEYVLAHPDCCKTLVIDTADWAEQIEIKSLCDKNGWDGLEGAGYGKGYTYSAEEFAKLLNLLTEATQAGIHVVVTAHAQMRKVELPEEMGAYDHWEMKTSKKVAPMIREWADAVFFANYKTIVVNVDGKGAAKGKNKAQGGRRVMYTCHTPFWDAKNRYGLAEELPFDYGEIRHIIERDAEALAPDPGKKPEPVPAKPQKHEKAAGNKTGPAPAEEQPVSALPEAETKEEPKPQETAKSEPDMRIPKALRDLMIANNVSEWDIENVMEAKGYIPYGTKIWEYDTVNPGIVDGVLVAAWDQVFKAITEIKEKQEIPFN